MEKLKKGHLQRILSIVLALTLLFPHVTGNVQAAGEQPAAQLATFKYDNLAGASDRLMANGGASFLPSNIMQLTNGSTWQWGTVFNKNRITLNNKASFSTYFSFKLNPLTSGKKADGFTFTVQADSNTAGSSGGGLAYKGITKSVAIEFDTYKNTNDPNGNHIALLTNGVVPGESNSHASGTFVQNPGGFTNLADKNTYYVWIDYDGVNKQIEVRMNNSNTRPASTVLTRSNLDLQAIFGSSDVFTGFTASTGAEAEEHHISSWYFINDYQPIDVNNQSYGQAPTGYVLSKRYLDGGTVAVDISANEGAGAANSPIAITAINSITKQASTTVISSPSASLDANGKASVELSNIEPHTVIRVTGTAGIYNEQLVDNFISFKYDNFAGASSRMVLNGEAKVTSGGGDSNYLQLTPNSTYKYGTAFNKDRIELQNNGSFSTYFAFKIAPSSNRADGFTFTVQTTSNTSGSTGAGLGYEGIKKSVAIEFDTHKNDRDPNGNHIAINVNGVVPGSSSSHASGDYVQNPGSFTNFADNNTYYAWVEYNGRTQELEVRMNNMSIRPETAVLKKTNLNLIQNSFGQSEVYAGFTASTGSYTEEHKILSWYFNNDYEPFDVRYYSYEQAPTEYIVSPTYQLDGTVTLAIAGSGGTTANVPLTISAIDHVTNSTSATKVTPSKAGMNAGSATITLSEIRPNTKVRVTGPGGIYTEIVLANPKIASIAPVSDIDVALDTTLETVKTGLPQTTTITDSYGLSHTVQLNWAIPSYKADTAGFYNATGAFTLPSGVLQSSPAITLQVTAKVQVVASANADLSSLSFNTGALSPAFHAGTKDYQLVLDSDAPTAIALTAAISQSGASIQINNAAYTGAGHTLSVQSGDKVIITITAEDGKTKQEYVVNVLSRSKTSFVFDDFSHYTSLLQLNNDAQILDDDLVLTPNMTDKSGSAFYLRKVSLTNKRSFSTFFGFKMEGYGTYGQADGITFTMQTVSNTAGSSGGGIGYAGINPSFAIEFDSWSNSEFGDPSGPHIGVNTNGSMRSVATELSAPLDFRDGKQYYAWVDYDGENKTVEVRLSTTPNRPTLPTLTKTGVDLTKVLNMDEVFVGFTAGTGGASQRHSVQTWYFNNDLNPINISKYVYDEFPATLDLTATQEDSGDYSLSAVVRDKSGNPVSGVPVTFASTRGILSSSIGVTDASGIARSTLTVDGTPGVAIVTAVVEGGAFNSETITLTISDQKAVDADAELLQLIYALGDSEQSVTQNIGLPITGSNGTTLTWTSSNNALITDQGEVTRPLYNESDEDVVLTVTVTRGATITTKTFTLKVKKQPYVAPTLTNSQTTFVESSANDGSIVGDQIITIAGGSFDLYLSEADVIVNNLPAGLEYAVSVPQPDKLHISFSGKAHNHQSDHSAEHVSITVKQDKVEGALADLTTEPFSVTFVDPPVITVTGVVYEYPFDSGKLINTLKVTISKGTFTNDIDEDGISVEHLPAGISLQMVKESDTTISLTFVGDAVDHDNIHDEHDAYVVIQSQYMNGSSIPLKSNTFKINFNEPEPYLMVMSAVMYESEANDGSMNGQLVVELMHGTWNDDISPADLNIASLPAGLTISNVSKSGNTLTIEFAGKANNHRTSNNVDDLIVTVSNDLVTPTATQILSNDLIVLTAPVESNSFSILFRDPLVALHVSGDIEDNAEGEITEPLIIDLANGTFDTTLSDEAILSGITFNNLPEGISINIESISSTQIVISFTGTALSQNSASKNASVTVSGNLINGLAEPVTSNTFEINALSDQAIVNIDWNNLAIVYQSGDSSSAVTGNVGLPTAGFNGSTITWSSDAAGIIDASGQVTRPHYSVGDRTVTLTATVEHDGTLLTKTFELTVILVPMSDREAVDLDKADLESGNAIHYRTGDSLNHVTDNLGLVFVGDNGSSIVWSADPAGYISPTGQVTRPENSQGDVQVTLTATITKGGITEQVNYTLTVIAEPIDAADLADAKAAAYAAIAAAIAAQNAYLEVGEASDSIYTSVETAIAQLEIALGENPLVLQNIQDATDQLTDATDALILATASAKDLAGTLANANEAIDAANESMNAYLAVDGDTDLAVYKDVEDARNALLDALAKNPQNPIEIVAATADLTGKTTSLKAETENILNEVLSKAQEAISAAETAIITYLLAEGDPTDTVYLDIQNALDALNMKLQATPLVLADIESSTMALEAATNELLKVINAQRLQASIDEANALINTANAAKAAYSAADGDPSDQAYMHVEAALADLQDALNQTPQVLSDIETAIQALNSAVTALDNAKLDQLLQKVMDARTNASIAESEYLTAGGKSTDPAYAAVESALANLDAAVGATPLSIDDTKAAIAALNAATATLKAATEIAAAISTIKTMDDAHERIDQLKSNGALANDQKQKLFEQLIEFVLDSDGIVLKTTADLSAIKDAIENESGYSDTEKQEKLAQLADKAITELSRPDTPSTPGGVDFQKTENISVKNVINMIDDDETRDRLTEKQYAEVAARSLTISTAFTFNPGDTWESITRPFFAIEEGLYNTSITWTSNKPSIKVAKDSHDQTIGEVTRQSDDASVLMTATIRNGTQSQTRTFLLIVKSNQFGDKEVETEKRDVDVKIGNNTGAKSPSIERINLKDRDTNTVIKNKIDKLVVEPALVTGAGGDPIVIYIPDNKADIADEIAVEVPKSTVEQLGNQLVIQTDQATITLPQASIEQAQNDGQEFYFRIVPIRQATKIQQVKSELTHNVTVQLAAGDKKVQLLGIPREIETNYSGYQTMITLPLTNITIPATNEAEFLASLRVFIQHSDGDEVVTGTIDYNGDGRPVGISFTINKFSTFTVIRLNDNTGGGSGGGDTEGESGDVEETEAPIEGAEGFHTRYISGYSDGTFKPERQITRAEMAAIFARILDYKSDGAVTASSYPDVKQSHWAVGMIEFVRKTGLIIGDSNGNYRPDAPITRGEMAVIVTRFKNLTISQNAESSFTDVNSHWAVNYIEAARQAGFITGYNNGTYRPNGNLTRAEAVTIINRLLERGPLHGVSTPTWRDVPVIHWAYEEIEEASQDHNYKQAPEGREMFNN